MHGDEVVVMQVRIGAVDSINLFELTWAECFMLVEAPDALQQTLAAEDLMQSGDAATEAVRGIKESGIAVRDLDTEAE